MLFCLYSSSLSVFRSVCLSVNYSDCLHLQISSVCLFSCMCLPNFLFLSVCPAKFTLSVFLPVVAKFTLPVYFTLYLQKFTMTFRQFQSFCFSICLYVSAKLSLSVCLSVSANCLDPVSVFFVSLCIYKHIYKHYTYIEVNTNTIYKPYSFYKYLYLCKYTNFIASPLLLCLTVSLSPVSEAVSESRSISMLSSGCRSSASLHHQTKYQLSHFY